jgi:hypothetical protein
MKTFKTISFATILGAVIFTGCRKDEITNPAAPAGQATMKVRMTDAPGDFASLHVQLMRVEAYALDSGWITLNNQSQMVNVLSLNNGISTNLTADVAVDAGVYTQVRLTFGGQNTLGLYAGASLGSTTVNTNTTITLGVDSMYQVVIPVNENITAGEHADILLDFNAAASVQATLTGYDLEPVITEVQDNAGGISGEITGGANAAVTISNGAMQFSTYANASGNFMAGGLAAGTYTVTIHATPQEIAAGAQASIVIQDVVVTEGQITGMGRVVL